MNRWQRRTAGYLAGLAGVILGYAVVYNWGMAAFEGEPQGFLRSLQIVVETFTTTGFGSDAPWETPAMNVLVIVMDLTGVVLIFIALPVFFFPLFEETLSRSAPESTDLTDHVVVLGHTPRGEALASELEAADVPHVFVEPDRETARELDADDVPVVHADPERTEAFAAANAAEARGVVVDLADETTPSAVLTAEEAAPEPELVAVVEESETVRYVEMAGADDVLVPRRALGRSLARKASVAPAVEVDDAVELGESFEVTELIVEEGSDLAGTTLRESGVREELGVNVVGAWFRGEFVPAPRPGTYVDDHTVLLAAGGHEELEALRTRAHPREPDRDGPVVVAGYGMVGRSVADELREAGVPVTVIDRDGPEADVVGDATDPDTLRRAGADEAAAVVVALSDDTAAAFATLVAEEELPETELVARANERGSVAKLYRAGADYVLSLATVTGRMLATRFLAEDIVAADTQVSLVRTPAPGLAGRTLAEADVRAATGATVVAVERDGDLRTDVGPDFRVRDDDRLVVAGTDGTVAAFYREYA